MGGIKTSPAFVKRPCRLANDLTARFFIPLQKAGTVIAYDSTNAKFIALAKPPSRRI
jgi:hypothetical protein